VAKIWQQAAHRHTNGTKRCYGRTREMSLRIRLKRQKPIFHGLSENRQICLHTAEVACSNHAGPTLKTLKRYEFSSLPFQADDRRIVRSGQKVATNSRKAFVQAVCSTLPKPRKEVPIKVQRASTVTPADSASLSPRQRVGGVGVGWLLILSSVMTGVLVSACRSVSG
jgi:hypothetical protein